MNKIDELVTFDELTITEYDLNLSDFTAIILKDANSTVQNNMTLSVPIAELTTLGTAVAALVPALNTFTQTVTIPLDGLYKVSNALPGDVLKNAKNGNYWGAIKTAKGVSKFAQFNKVENVTATVDSVQNINPATIMMAFALFAIEQKLKNIEEMQRQIITFLEIENESEIEADVEMLSNIINKYKFNWNNEHYVTSGHKMVMDIQRTSRKNMCLHQKKVLDILSCKKLIIVQSQVSKTLKNLLREFKYYRLSLYTFSLASMIEIMLSGNFKEEYVNGVKNEVVELSARYRNIFTECSVYLEKMSKASIDTNVLRGIGKVSNKVGHFIGNIDYIKEGQVDEFLQDSGSSITNNVKEIQIGIISAFAEISNPNTRIIIDRMDEMVRIYNYTECICIDENYLYLVPEQ